ncbi:MAG: MarR family transcriptional regulator [Bdellovibrionota bacterium]
MKRPMSKLADEIKQTKPFDSPRQEASIALLRTADMLRRHASQLVEPEGITLQQYNVLRILRGAGPDGLPTLEIGNRMVEEVPGITRLVDKLERRKLLERERSISDRRSVICRITSSGKKLLERLDRPIKEIDNDMLSVLSNVEVERLLKLLDALRAELGARRAKQQQSEERRPRSRK